MLKTKQTSIVAHHGPTSPLSGLLIGSVAVDQPSGGYPWCADHKFPEHIQDVNSYFMDKAAEEKGFQDYSDGGKRIKNDISIFFSKYLTDIGGKQEKYQFNKNIDIIVSSVEFDFSDVFNIKTTVLRKIRLVGLEVERDSPLLSTRVNVFEMPVE